MRGCANGHRFRSGRAEVSGLLWANGEVRFNGSGTFNGTIIAGGDVLLNGSYGVFNYTKSLPGGPTPGVAPTDDLYITAWQK